MGERRSGGIPDSNKRTSLNKLEFETQIHQGFERITQDTTPDIDAIGSCHRDTASIFSHLPLEGPLRELGVLQGCLVMDT